MNKKNFNPGRHISSPFAAIMLMLLLTISSCQKRETGMADPADDLTNSSDEITAISKILEGEVIYSSISNESDADGLAIIYKDGKEIVGMERIPSGIIEATGNIQYAELIYSKFGVLIRDTDTKKIWLYINNDTESRERFKSVRSYLHVNPFLSEIAGTIRIKISEDEKSVVIL